MAMSPKPLPEARDVFNEHIGAGAEGQTKTSRTVAHRNVLQSVRVWPRQIH